MTGTRSVEGIGRETFFDMHEVKEEGEEFDFLKNIFYISVGHEAGASVRLFPQYLILRHHLILPLLLNSIRNLKSSYSLCSGRSRTKSFD
jgi:hypothetical protein